MTRHGRRSLRAFTRAIRSAVGSPSAIPTDYKTITGLVLNEISLVDRPANPEAVFDYWKAAGASTHAGNPVQPAIPDLGLRRARAPSSCQGGCAEVSGTGLRRLRGCELIAAERRESRSPPSKMRWKRPKAKQASDVATAMSSSMPIPAIRRTATSAIRSTPKTYPRRLEFHQPARAMQSDTPQPSSTQIKTQIIAAWKEKIDKDGPPSAGDNKKAGRSRRISRLTKALWDVGHVARIILDLDWLKESLAVEAAMEGDDSPQPARLQAIIGELCGFLNALVAEETGEILDDAEAVGNAGRSATRPRYHGHGCRRHGCRPYRRFVQRPRARKCRNSPQRSSPNPSIARATRRCSISPIRRLDKCMGMDGFCLPREATWPRRAMR